MNLTRYNELYNAFIDAYQKGHVGPEDIGAKIAEIGKESLMLNLAAIELRRKYRNRKAELSRGIDPDTSKAIAAGKAETMAEATVESHALDEIESHAANCGNAIWYLRDLKEGVSQEMRAA